jgi:hypothetical protein
MQQTPLRKDLVRWCGYKYDKEKDFYWREGSTVLLRVYTTGEWIAYLAAQPGKENPFLCTISGLGQLTLLCLAIDGDDQPLIIKIPKKKK